MDAIKCPHCKEKVDMTDCERLQGHVTYWGEDGPLPIDCPSCDAEFFIEEHVSRWWTAGKTRDDVP